MNYLKDDNGNDSSTRIAFWYGILWSTLFTTVFAFIKSVDWPGIVGLFGGISGSFFALKLIQKKIEKK